MNICDWLLALLLSFETGLLMQVTTTLPVRKANAPS